MQNIEFSPETLSLYRALNSPARGFSPDQSVQAVFESQASRTPGSTALICGSKRYTYAELNSRSNALAKVLRKRGVTKNSMVAVYCTRSIELIETLVAIVKCGAAYVPMDPSWPENHLWFLLSEIKCCLLVKNDNAGDFERVPPCDVISLQETTLESDYENPPLYSRSDGIIYVNFTSGSTGKPKGVPIPHAGVLSLVSNANYVPLNEKTRTLHMAPIAFDAATFEIWAPLLNGGTCVLYENPSIQLTDVSRAISHGSVNTIFLTTALFNTFVDVAPSALKFVKHILTGGEAHSAKHIAKALDFYGSDKVTSVYGPTECTTFSSFYPVVRKPNSDESYPIGKPIQDTGIYILDGCRACNVGETGVIHLTGPSLASGYLNNPGQTSRRFRNLVIDGLEQRVYDTGDLGRLNADLDVVFLGREDDQVKVNGYRIELGEVSAYLNALPQVQQCYVTTSKNASGETTLYGFVLVNDRSVNVDEMRNALAESLPSYMLPHLVLRTSSFPLTPTHKIDQKALLASLSQQPANLSRSAAKVQGTLASLGVSAKVRELPASTRTAADAAEALGCDIAQIVKSMVFQTKSGQRPVLVLTSGPNRIDTKIIASIVGQPIKQASPDFVRKVTGFAIGGVPPIGHKISSQVIVDEDLTKLECVWAAAGTPNAVFCIDQPLTSILSEFSVAAIKETPDA